MSETLKWRERARLSSLVREFFESRDFLELDTPIAVVCPGTEVHLSYFETSWMDHIRNSHRLFLRSSPELHMKQALAAGYHRIFQLGKCFRNAGELSEWHQPEFTMLEWYRVGQSYEGLISETEEFLRFTAEKMSQVTGIEPAKILPTEFERISVFDAFERFAGVTLIDGDVDLAHRCREAGVQSILADDDFETAYFKTLIEKIEPEIAARRGVVLFDYPPSQAALAVVQGGRACRFEFYLGRVELCNGFFELTGGPENRNRVREAMRERVHAGHTAVPEDEDFYSAMERLKEPCAGNALGFDRWLAILCGETSLDPVIPFRRTGVFKE